DPGRDLLPRERRGRPALRGARPARAARLTRQQPRHGGFHCDICDHMSSVVDAYTAIENHLWMHESSRRDLYELDMLRVFVRGEGCWLEDSRGERYFDLCSSMWQASL